MLTELLPFQIVWNPVVIAGASLWSLALYLGFFPVSEWLIHQLTRWLNFAERSLYLSAQEFEKTRTHREAQNAFYASLFSIVPFLAMGGLCNYGLDLTLGRSWAVSLGIMSCIGCAVYELGRRDGQSPP